MVHVGVCELAVGIRNIDAAIEVIRNIAVKTKIDLFLRFLFSPFVL